VLGRLYLLQETTPGTREEEREGREGGREGESERGREMKSIKRSERFTNKKIYTS
jgi:hypothetical protein